MFKSLVGSVDTPSVAGGEPFAGGFRLVDAGLEENSHFRALRQREVSRRVAFERGADTFRKLLLRLNDHIAVTLPETLIGIAFFFFQVAHGNYYSYKFHDFS